MHHDDQKRKDRDQQERPNRESNMEPAEGSRENTRTAGNQGGRGTSTMDPEAPRGGQDSEGGSELPPESFGEQGGGISNRPIEEEESRQENLPPRGERREDWKDD